MADGNEFELGCFHNLGAGCVSDSLPNIPLPDSESGKGINGRGMEGAALLRGKDAVERVLTEAGREAGRGAILEISPAQCAEKNADETLRPERTLETISCPAFPPSLAGRIFLSLPNLGRCPRLISEVAPRQPGRRMVFLPASFISRVVFVAAEPAARLARGCPAETC